MAFRSKTFVLVTSKEMKSQKKNLMIKWKIIDFTSNFVQQFIFDVLHYSKSQSKEVVVWNSSFFLNESIFALL